MVRYLATKFVYLFLTLGAVLTTNFLIFHLMPGDPVTHIARGASTSMPLPWPGCGRTTGSTDR